MFHLSDKPVNTGLLLDSIETTERVLRYSKSNKFEHTQISKMIEREDKRTINVHVSLAAGA